jgi:hypothetical protein
MIQKLSGIIAEHIRAVNAFDPEAIVATFAEDGQFNWVSPTKCAWCELRQDFRTFRTDRIVAMTQLDRYPAQRADLVRHLRTHLDRLANGKISVDGN